MMWNSRKALNKSGQFREWLDINVVESRLKWDEIDGGVGK